MAGPTKQEAENRDHSVLQSQVDLQGIPGNAIFNVCLQSPEEEHHKIARQLWEEKQVNEELPGQITNLQFEEASLQHENSHLESETQHQKLKLQILPESYEDHLTQLQKHQGRNELLRNGQETSQYVCRYMHSAYQICNLQEDGGRPGQGIGEKHFYQGKKDCLLSKRAEESWNTAKWVERKFTEVRKEIDRNRQMLAKVKSKVQPFPSGPVAQPTAHRDPESGEPMGH